MFFEVDVAKRRGDADFAFSFRSDAATTALIGPSGAGKTSLLHMISGILRPDRGSIRVAGRTLFDRGTGIDLAPEDRRCGYVFQDMRLFPHLDVRANLLYASRRNGGGRSFIGFAETVALLGIAHLLGRRPATLSGGEARRVVIGRALLSGPDFLLLDEPLVSLDAARREDMLATLERLRDEVRLPILLVSHQEEEVERLAGRMVTVAPG